MLAGHCPVHTAQLTVVFDQPVFENGGCHSPAAE